MAPRISRTNSARIRRDAVDPVFRRQGLRNPTHLPIESDGEKLVLLHNRPRWVVPDDNACACVRTWRAKLLVDGAHAGSFKLSEVRLSPDADTSDLLDWADEASAELTCLAETIIEHWSRAYEITDHGTILDFSLAWMHPAYSRTDRFAAATGALLGLCADRSLMILRASPLEYSAPVDDCIAEAREHRRRAMMRYYRRTLGVVPLPGRSGKDGWMYAIPTDRPVPGPEGGR